MRRFSQLAIIPFRFWLLLATALTTSLPNQTEADQNTEWYQVEVIVFSQQDLFQNEQYPTNIRLHYPENWRQLDNHAFTPADTQRPAAEQPFTRLAQTEFKLGPDDYALNRAAGYRVLAHMAWRQPGLGQQQSPWIIVSGGHPNGNRHELEGSIRLVLTRYLHIQADLWKTSFGETPRVGSISANNRDQQDSWPKLPAQPWLIATSAPDNYTRTATTNTSSPTDERHTPIKKIIALKQSERVNLNELTYLDHPEMGVLVLVTRHTVATINGDHR